MLFIAQSVPCGVCVIYSSVSTLWCVCVIYSSVSTLCSCGMCMVFIAQSVLVICAVDLVLSPQD